MPKATSNNNKLSFGKRKGGKAKKRKSPKQKPTKESRGQN